MIQHQSHCWRTTMKFFIPHAKDDVHAEEVYDGIKRFVGEQTFGMVTSRRIYSVRFVHDGVFYTAKVGSVFERTGEPVVAILEGAVIYYICTPTRGVHQEVPYLVGRRQVDEIEEFESESG